MFIASGPLRVTIKYVEERAATCIFQRGIRLSVRERYGGQKKIAIDLKTKDPAKVARLVAHLNAQLEAEWNALEQDPQRTPRAVSLPGGSPKLAPADALLDRWGLKPLAPGQGVGTHDPMALALLHDHFDRKREAFARGDAHVYRAAHPSDYLNDVEAAAWRRLYVPPKDTISDVLRVYVENHKQRNDEGFRERAASYFKPLLAELGDVAVESVDRDAAKRFVGAMLAAGRKTTTVRRYLATLGPAWGSYIVEKGLRREMDNPFERLTIAGEGDDAEKRGVYTVADLQTLYAACRKADDEIRWLFALMIDTGTRISEIAGLATADIHLDAPVPYVALVNHPWRTLKGTGRAVGHPRDVPLVGASLWAAQRVVDAASQRTGPTAAFAFPRYTNTARCKGTHASNALVKWVRKHGGSALAGDTNHGLRHAIKDRLREVQCPKEISNAITGHGAKDVSDGYGLGYSLEVKQEWLLKVALPWPVSDGRLPGDGPGGDLEAPERPALHRYPDTHSTL